MFFFSEDKPTEQKIYSKSESKTCYTSPYILKLAQKQYQSSLFLGVLFSNEHPNQKKK